MTLPAAQPSPVVVVADADAEIRDTVAGFMSARGYRVEAAADPDAAAGLLVGRKVDVLIADLAMRDRRGIELLTFARASAPATRSIAIAADATARDRDAALRLGAVRVLAKPLSLLELADAIGLARDCAVGFHGWMHRMSLVDVLQMYHHAAQSLVLHLRGDVEGSIAFRHGDLVHAECGEKSGMAALVELLSAQRGELETSALTDALRTISLPFDHALLDGLRALDESRGVRGPSLALGSDPWFTDSPSRDQIDRDALVAWLAANAPGAGVWWVDTEAAVIERLDPLGASPEVELGGTPGSLGWAFELAEAADPSWTRVELTTGTVAIALLRAHGVTLAFARMVTGDAVQRRFHLEVVQLVRWLNDHAGAPR
jgi:CheY-like chemotaxis protein